MIKNIQLGHLDVLAVPGKPLRGVHLDEFETLQAKQKIVVSPPRQHEHPFKKVVKNFP